ncbi:MAG TPA: hypothetical protein VM369_08195 [Candidatus Binatia bacterium]|nr:hypothetical protein [Candidatus Binatia bacterium]
MNITKKLVTAAALALMAAGCANDPAANATASPEFMKRIETGEFSRYEQICRESTTAEARERNCAPQK